VLTAQRANDPLLDPLLEAATAEERQRAIADLLAGHAYARIDRILAMKFRQSSLQDEERQDLRAEIVLRLVNRLHRLAEDPDAEPLISLGDYVAGVTLNAYNDLLRRLFPNRARLRSRVRYALGNDSRLALWSAGETSIAGLAAWSGQRDDTAPVTELPDLPPGDDLPQLLVTLFERVGHPIALDDLIALLAEVLGITDRTPDVPPTKEIVAPFRDPSEDLEKLQYLRALWEQIRELPLPQRIALLLSARDAEGESVAYFLPATGVAAIRQIAATLDMDARELAGLWSKLPLDDFRIAELLKTTRPHVITLRRAARERLARLR